MMTIRMSDVERESDRVGTPSTQTTYPQVENRFRTSNATRGARYSQRNTRAYFPYDSTDAYSPKEGLDENEPDAFGKNTLTLPGVNLYNILPNRRKPVLPNLTNKRARIKCDRNKIVNRVKPFTQKGYHTMPLPSPLFQPRMVRQTTHDVKVLTGVTIRKVRPAALTQLPSVTTGTTPVHIDPNYLNTTQQ